MADLNNLFHYIETCDVESIKKIMEQENLKIENGKLVPVDKDSIKDKAEYWDSIQMIRKIQLNSTYGGVTNNGSIFFDQRLGQSCTLSGRCTTRHMASKINETIVGKYEIGDAIVYGDSVAGDSIIRTSIGSMSIADLYNKIEKTVYMENGKEYAIPTNENIQIVGYDIANDKAIMTNFNFVMRHKTNKNKWEVTTEDGKSVIVTDDHSIMVERNGNLVEVKPNDLLENDVVIVVNDQNISRNSIKSFIHLGTFDNEYVYDLSVKDNDTVFFANDLLISNTDSNYFTVPNPDDYTKDQFIDYADKVANIANNSFPEFFQKTFNVRPEMSKPIKCAREICATAGLFIKKKRYTAMVYDEKGFRKDDNGKKGKLKVMGLDIKRADCPEWVQDKLEETIQILLGDGKSIDDILEFIQDWRQQFSEFDPWKMGIPKRVNKLTYYNQMFIAKTKGVTIPGHVRAAINWNNMLDQFHDRNSMKIGDGGKVIVCKLKKNKYNMDSIAYPIDQAFLPDWFKHLPYDNDTMIEVAVDQKVKNIFGILGWDLEITKRPKQFSTLFTME